MKPRRTVHSTRTLSLPGGTEDNDLWIYDLPDDEHMNVMCSVWEPSAQERDAIAKGENIRLLVWGRGHPPVAMETTDEPLGKAVTQHE